MTSTLRPISFRRLGTAEVHQRYLENDPDLTAFLGARPRTIAELLQRAPKPGDRLLPRAARRYDPEDPATVRRVLDALDDDPVLLEILAVLAEADAVGTGPGVWTPWLAGLVGDLVARCRAALGASMSVSGP